MTSTMTIFFWLSFLAVAYTYIFYGLIIFFLTRIKAIYKPSASRKKGSKTFEPEVTFITAAFNEEAYIEDKIRNILQFDYPASKLHILFVTDGSDDSTLDKIQGFPYPEEAVVHWEHRPERRGKIAAVDRIMPLVKTPIVIYSDANAYVNAKAIRNIVRHYEDPQVGGVAGEKRIYMNPESEKAAASGEGIYWRYESALKRLDYQLYSCIGAAGELFSLRTELYHPVHKDSIIEDFMLSMNVNRKGYKMAYEPDAYASETSSATVEEELKRKIRIAAGGYQSFFRLLDLLNPFRYGVLSFQYFSHRVMRWIIAPLALVLLLVSNVWLAFEGIPAYQWLLAAHLLFYLLALIGHLIRNQKIRLKLFFIPYYFTITNICQIRGGIRYFSGQQSVVWEKSKRAPSQSSNKN
jgi:biofilm PGA synthesis N-glycosyltransferase PgaC